MYILKMVGASILPVAIHNNELHFLFGKEKKVHQGSLISVEDVRTEKVYTRQH